MGTTAKRSICEFEEEEKEKEREKDGFCEDKYLGSCFDRKIFSSCSEQNNIFIFFLATCPDVSEGYVIYFPVTEQPLSRADTVCMRVSHCTPQSCMPIISGPSVVPSFHGNRSMRAQKGVETIMAVENAAKGKRWRSPV